MHQPPTPSQPVTRPPPADRYAETRSQEQRQEVDYNLARAYHSLGIYHLAVTNYWKVLNEAGSRADRGLQREAAFNLHHIYRESGNRVLAAQVLRDHCFV